MKVLHGVLALLLLCAGVQMAAGAEVYAYAGQWGSTGVSPGHFDGPSGIAVDGYGYVWVADYGNDRVEVFHAMSGALVGMFPAPNPMGVSANTPDGSVWVTDFDFNAIRKYSRAGVPLMAKGAAGSAPGFFNGPWGIDIDGGGYINVVDSGNDRVQIFRPVGTVGWIIPSGLAPTGIAVYGDDYIYVVDYAACRVNRYLWTNNAWIGAWGSHGSGPGQFIEPRGIAVDDAGNVYVADTGNNRIQKFTPGGQFVTSWGGYGTGNGQFDSPYGVAVDGAGFVYVADTGNNRIQKFAPPWWVSGFRANFTAGPRTGLEPLTVQFTDLTTGGQPDSWDWSFGDGIGSFQQNPSHTYDEPGTYDVSLRVTDATLGSNMEYKVGYIRVNPRPDFTAVPRSGFAPLSVQFTDTSPGSPVSWFWDFGDGVNSSLANPSHTYTGPGSYNVTLSVSWVEGSRTTSETKTGYITVVPDFTASPETGCAPLAVQFTDTTGGNPTSWLWDFGDGTTSTEQNPRHVYQESGLYPAVLSVSSSHTSGTSSTSHWIIVHPLEDGLVRIEAENYDEGGEGVAYHDTTTGNAGNIYRDDDVDIASMGGGEYAVTDTADGEWTRYTVYGPKQVDVEVPITLRVRASDRGRSIGVRVNNVTVNRIDIPGSGAFTDVRTNKGVLRPGPNEIAIWHYRSIGSTATLDFDYLTLDMDGNVVTVPGGAGRPTDPDGDGLYDDVNGNGRPDFADVVLYFNQMTWIAANEPVSAFDYNANGRIDFADVVWLFNRL